MDVYFTNPSAENLVILPVIFIIGGFVFSFLSGFVLLFPKFRNFPLRWQLVCVGLLTPIITFILLEYGGYYANNFSIVPILPYIFAYLVLGISFYKSIKNKIRFEQIYIFFMMLFITWSIFVTWLAMDNCFMGACV